MMQQFQQMQQQGVDPNAIIDSFIQSQPNNQMLQAIKGKSPDEIMKYAESVVDSAGIAG